jgi:cytochrome P450
MEWYVTVDTCWVRWLIQADIYGFNRNTNKPEAFYSAFRVNKHAVTTFNSTSKESHRRKRRIMAKAFSNNALPGYEPLIGHCIEEMLEKFNGNLPVAEKASAQWREFNMALELNYLMLDIMGGLCFGEAFGFVAGKGTDIVSQIHKRAFRIYMVSHTLNIVTALTNSY